VFASGPRGRDLVDALYLSAVTRLVAVERD